MPSGHLLVVLVDDLRLVAGHHVAHRPRPLPAVAGADHRVRLGHPEAVAQDQPKRSRNSSCRSAGVAGASATRSRCCALGGRSGRLGEDRDHRAEQVGDRRVGLDDAIPEARGREARPDDELRAVHERLHAGVQRVRVEERQAGVEHVVVAESVEHRCGRARPPVELRLRAHDALGGAGRARRCRGSRRCRPGRTGRGATRVARGPGTARRARRATRRCRSASSDPDALEPARHLVEHVQVTEELGLDREHAWLGVR